MNGELSMLELAPFGQALVWLAVAAIFLMTRQASLFHPLTVYLLFHALVFVVRPWTVHYLNFDREWLYIRFEPSSEQFIRSLMASSLALLVFAATTLAFGWCRPQFQTAVPESFNPRQKQALLILTMLLTPLIVYSLHGLFSGAFAVEDRGGTYVISSGSGYALEAQHMAGPLICAWLAVTRFRWYSLLVLAPYIFIRSYAGTSRWTIVLVLLAVGLVYAWQKRLVRNRQSGRSCARFLFICCFTRSETIARWWRILYAAKASSNRLKWPASPAGTELKAKYDSPDFANFDYLTFVMSVVPERTGMYTYGGQYAQLFTEPIPRQLWPGKPVGSPIRLFNLNNYGHFFGLTPSLVGDGWMSGGWLGIIITMTVVGAILGFLHRWFWRHSGNNMAALCYLIGLAMLPQWYRDGGISIAKFVFWNLSPLLLWIGLTWILNGCQTRARSILLPRFARIRLVFTGADGSTPANRRRPG